MKNKHTILAAAITLAIFSPGISSGALVATFTTATVASGTITATTGDLLEMQLSSYTAVEFNGVPARAVVLYDGTISTATDNTGVFKAGTGESVTFNLNLITNVLGYDITSLKTIAHWTDARAGQAWTVEYSVVGSSSFTNLYTLADQPASNLVTRVVLADGSSVIASGVDAIRFIFDDVGTSTWQGYREIDVIGAATVIPEPASALLGGLGMLALLRRRRA